ncbi:hypothetical protein FVE85_7461 [Porphyridium purpureum]|uniref:Uncharacterized protein n=1 Tax=Porphyridium purpureum TaxID=35688 RepID=A0A5J4Z7Z9_PORPP|nr:hypothetical protein FVE85_7461 [Porphyridium purpureum]|eukprot:POR8683..scf295_1
MAQDGMSMSVKSSYESFETAKAEPDHDLPPQRFHALPTGAPPGWQSQSPVSPQIELERQNHPHHVPKEPKQAAQHKWHETVTIVNDAQGMQAPQLPPQLSPQLSPDMEAQQRGSEESDVHHRNSQHTGSPQHDMGSDGAHEGLNRALEGSDGAHEGSDGAYVGSDGPHSGYRLPPADMSCKTALTEEPMSGVMALTGLDFEVATDETPDAGSSDLDRMRSPKGGSVRTHAGMMGRQSSKKNVAGANSESGPVRTRSRPNPVFRTMKSEVVSSSKSPRARDSTKGRSPRWGGIAVIGNDLLYDSTQPRAFSRGKSISSQVFGRSNTAKGIDGEGASSASAARSPSQQQSTLPQVSPRASSKPQTGRTGKEGRASSLKDMSGSLISLLGGGGSAASASHGPGQKPSLAGNESGVPDIFARGSSAARHRTRPSEAFSMEWSSKGGLNARLPQSRMSGGGGTGSGAKRSPGPQIFRSVSRSGKMDLSPDAVSEGAMHVASHGSHESSLSQSGSEQSQVSISMGGCWIRDILHIFHRPLEQEVGMIQRMMSSLVVLAHTLNQAEFTEYMGCWKVCEEVVIDVLALELSTLLQFVESKRSTCAFALASWKMGKSREVVYEKMNVISDQWRELLRLVSSDETQARDVLSSAEQLEMSMAELAAVLDKVFEQLEGALPAWFERHSNGPERDMIDEGIKDGIMKKIKRPDILLPMISRWLHGVSPLFHDIWMTSMLKGAKRIQFPLWRKAYEEKHVKVCESAQSRSLMYEEGGSRMADIRGV